MSPAWATSSVITETNHGICLLLDYSSPVNKHQVPAWVVQTDWSVTVRSEDGAHRSWVYADELKFRFPVQNSWRFWVSGSAEREATSLHHFLSFPSDRLFLFFALRTRERWNASQSTIPSSEETFWFLKSSFKEFGTCWGVGGGGVISLDNYQAECERFWQVDTPTVIFEWRKKCNYYTLFLTCLASG